MSIAFSFLVAFFVTLTELLTSRYPRTAFLLRTSWKLYAYAGIYASLSAGVFLGLRQLVAADLIALSGPVLSSAWVQAAVVGLSTKALLHIRVFSVTAGGKDFPVGIETLVQLFEPWLLREIELFHFNRLGEFLVPFAKTYPDLDLVKQKIAENVPPKLPSPERNAFLYDIEKAERVEQALEQYLSFLGKDSLVRVFPLP